MAGGGKGKKSRMRGMVNARRKSTIATSDARIAGRAFSALN